MNLSVILATYDRRALLEQTLPGVFAQDLPPGDFEVVVVDDGSRDDTLAYLKTLRPPCGFQFLSQPNRGQAAAINAGLRVARGEYVLFLDDDIQCGPGLLRAHLEAHAGREDRLVFGPVLLSPDSPRSFAAEYARTFCDDYFADLERHPERAGHGWYFAFGNANSSGHRGLLTRAGGLREELIRSNDLEYGFRLWRAGARFTYAPRAAVHQRWVKPLRAIALDEPRLEAEAEVLISRAHPAYRQHARITSLAGDPWWRYVLRCALVRLPFDLAPLFYAATRVCAAVRRIPPLGRMARALLEATAGLALFRRAVRVTGGWRSFRREFAMRLPVLLYHRVGERQPGEFHGLSITAGEFEKQLRWLRRHGYETVTPEAWAAWVRDGAALPEKPVLITIDDAYADLEQHALPALERHGFTATIYVVTSEVGGSNQWDQQNGYARAELMSAEQIRKWRQRGFRFAAHSRTHPDLTRVSDAQLRDELEGSRDDLARVLGEAPRSFAYPYGYYDERAAAAATRVFETALTCDPGVNHMRVPLSRLRRTSMERFYTWFDPAVQVWWGTNPLRTLRVRLGLARRRLFGAARSKTTAAG